MRQHPLTVHRIVSNSIKYFSLPVTAIQNESLKCKKNEDEIREFQLYQLHRIISELWKRLDKLYEKLHPAKHMVVVHAIDCS